MEFDSAFHVGGPTQELAQDIATDAAGNSYVTGSFGSLDLNGDGSDDGVDFDPGPGEYKLFGNSAGSSAFVAKYSATGEFVWAWNAVGAVSNLTGQGKSIAVDGDGNVYATGYFGGTTDFDPEGQAANSDLTSQGSNDVFVLKLDSNGAFEWVNQVGGIDQDIGEAVVVDAGGNVYATGNVSSAAFVVKYNSQGSQLWDRRIASADGRGIALDGSANVHVTGNFHGKVDFNPGSGVYNLSSGGRKNSSDSAFVLKLTSDGNFTWARNFAVTGNSGGSVGNDIAVDGAGSVYTTGESLGGTCDYDPGTQTYSLSGHFLSKLNSSGQFVWAKQLGGHGIALALDGSGNAYVAGHFQGTADFNPGAGTFQMASVGGTWDGFATRLDANGNFAWAVQMGSARSDKATGIALGPQDSVNVTGFFGDLNPPTPTTADFDFLNTYPDDHDLLTSAGKEDFFVWKLIQPSALQAAGVDAALLLYMDELAPANRSLRGKK